MSDNPSADGDNGIIHDEDLAIKKSDVISSEITMIRSDDLTSTALLRRWRRNHCCGFSRGLINVYENIPFAGGDGDYSILSVLFGENSVS